MPKAITYKANSVIYFRGDTGDKIYILKGGRISLNSNDIETGQDIHDQIQTGEFFGVKSAMGKYPREETALVLTDASVIAFSVPEFEQLVSKNTRVIMKMLKVFSNQLRRLHGKVSTLLAQDEQSDPEEGLYRIGEYYLRKKEYSKARYAFNKYLTYYPSGRFHQDANKFAQTAEAYLLKYGSGKGPTAVGLSAPSSPSGGSAASPGSSARDSSSGLSNVAQKYYDAVSTFSQQKYPEALASFKHIAESSDDEEYTVKALFEIGRCLYTMQQYDAAIKHFTSFVQRYPKSPDLKDALFYVGQSYQQKGEKERAGSFYSKILSMEPVEDGLKRKVQKAVRSLEQEA
ncbi:MAG: outer membrane protein assembly factor BamD [Spirochaetaceae bacterium]|nr:MAG: outer membrane protein assembly factor BamD [Spirochaetaceae bacterium]